jgi:hypothetical protein
MTERDLEIVRWVGRVGAVTIDHVARRFELGRSVAYERVAACVDFGLLARTPVLHRTPALLTATREGLRVVGLGIRPVRLSPALATHHLVCGAVAVWLEERHRGALVLSERELRFEEQLAGRPIASAPVGARPDGARRLHLPDFAVLGERSEAIEVELTPKAPRRLEHIVRSWRRAHHVESVTYFCAAGQTRRAVELAISRTRSEERVRCLPIEEVVG